MSQQSNPAVTAPGMPAGVQVIETGVNAGAAKAPVQSGPVRVPDTTGLGEPQAAALKESARLRGQYGETPSQGREALAKRIDALSQFALNGGPKPADFLPAENPPADMRPADSLRDTFEAIAQPATEQQRNAAVNLAMLQGVNPNLAREASSLCAELELSEGHTKAVMDRIRAHAGKSHFQKGADSIDVLEGRDFEIFAMEAARTIGGLDKLKDLRDKAAKYIEAKGLSERLESEGFWSSSLSLDPRFLIVLANAGLSRGGK